MKNRIVVLSMALAVGLAVLCAAADPVVVQPDAAGFTPTEWNLLLSELAKLETLLSDATLGPQLAPGAFGWTSREFARFTAWSLADRGYPVALASDATGTWILVGVSLPTQTVWVPIEATPAAGQIQTTLGRVPYQSRSSASIRYEARYVAFTAADGLPANAAPVARIRVDSLSVSVGDVITLSADESSDPDGQLVLYVWCVEGLPCSASSSWSFLFRATATGERTVRLIVIDHLGRPGTAQTVLVASRQPEIGEERGGPCGCGG